MAHQLKYYKEIESHGHLWRVEILQETEDTLTPMEIGPVLQGLRLVVQGDQADVDTPIVKTSLEMTFVDAPDLEQERKCGYWEEFYTSSATEYQVRLYKDGQIEWSGYVTPDSFSEDLRYRGSVSIIARDNLGALQDFPCNVQVDYITQDSRIYAFDLFASILNDSGIIAMEHQLASDSLSCPTPSGAIMGRYESGNQLWWQTFDIASLTKLNMYDALEQVLYSLGAVIRYVGNNTLNISTIRGMGLGVHDFWGDVPVKDVRFAAYGHRELAPAVKVIKDIIDFDKADDYTRSPNVLSYADTSGQYIDKLIIDINEQGEAEPDNSDGTIFRDEYIPVQGYELTQLDGGAIPASDSCLLNVAQYAKKSGYDSEEYGQWVDDTILYYAMGSKDECPIAARIDCYDSEYIQLRFHLKIDRPVSFFDQYATIGNTALTPPSFTGTGSPQLFYEIKIKAYSGDGSGLATRWLNTANNTWSSSKVTNAYTLEGYLWADSFYRYIGRPITEIDIPKIQLPFPGTITFSIIGTSEARCTVKVPNYGIYMRLRDFYIKAELKDNVKFPEKLTVTTKYRDTNNIALERTPSFGINPEYRSAAFLVANSILTEAESFAGGFIGQEKWAWGNNDGLTECSLSQLIHQQILAYYAKPNNVLTGELILEDDVPDFGSLWRWGGKDHLLMSGTLNVLTGRMENAVLREFTRYDRMWETWVENEDIDMDYPAGRMTFVVHTNKDLDQDTWQDFPSWISPVGHSKEEGDIYLFDCDIMENASGQERSAIFKIDTAYVRVTQRAAGDYGTDYGKDYS